MSFADFKRMAKAGMKDGGLMDLDGKEMDLRGGGFVPIGKKEKADDVPARLSKNEFVPITVSPIDPLSIVQFAPISTLSLIKT